jgi:hypothetical protein
MSFANAMRQSRCSMTSRISSTASPRRFGVSEGTLTCARRQLNQFAGSKGA